TVRGTSHTDTAAIREDMTLAPKKEIAPHAARGRLIMKMSSPSARRPSAGWGYPPERVRWPVDPEGAPLLGGKGLTGRFVDSASLVDQHMGNVSTGHQSGVATSPREKPS